jgi:hypothetical protein
MIDSCTSEVVVFT